ncbi:endo alpha-1,4 polygalactosaminidase [Kineosporia babensis]|uniref:Endo alpha-1,4 polygalactosaminidase n=1 Tax=Kineosporia babensis TaxID=499548 RepID=A0A9X1SS52_9ACTN|nr:endo alpha-1,4 polygalactosaminidase [Kineosporia babensis]MCD5310239.1 endo alpha-1,4 polygalactosaminidase [Kineosporia babensis]
MSSKRSNRRRIVMASAAGLVLLLGVGSYTVAGAANPWHDRGGRERPATSTPAPSPSTTPADENQNSADVTLPPANGQFDYQIGGAYEPATGVEIVDRDREAEPAAGKYNICYVNAFQTQPGDAEYWTGEQDDLLLKNADGEYVRDSEWDEYILDTSTEAKREALAGIVGEWIDGCAAAGFDAVEPDNLDTYTRSDELLTKDDNVAFSALLAQRAHEAGLAIAQKNTAELDQNDARTAGFDFAIAEECQVWKECDAYTDIYGDQVYEIEYTDNGRSAYATACKSQGQDISVILRDRDVVPAGKSAYHYQAC